MKNRKLSLNTMTCTHTLLVKMNTHEHTILELLRITSFLIKVIQILLGYYLSTSSTSLYCITGSLQILHYLLQS